MLTITMEELANRLTPTSTASAMLSRTSSLDRTVPSLPTPGALGPEAGKSENTDGECFASEKEPEFMEVGNGSRHSNISAGGEGGEPPGDYGLDMDNAKTHQLQPTEQAALADTVTLSYQTGNVRTSYKGDNGGSRQQLELTLEALSRVTLQHAAAAAEEWATARAERAELRVAAEEHCVIMRQILTVLATTTVSAPQENSHVCMQDNLPSMPVDETNLSERDVPVTAAAASIREILSGALMHGRKKMQDIQIEKLRENSTSLPATAASYPGSFAFSPQHFLSVDSVPEVDIAQESASNHNTHMQDTGNEGEEVRGGIRAVPPLIYFGASRAPVNSAFDQVYEVCPFSLQKQKRKQKQKQPPNATEPLLVKDGSVSRDHNCTTSNIASNANRVQFSVRGPKQESVTLIETEVADMDNELQNTFKRSEALCHTNCYTTMSQHADNQDSTSWADCGKMDLLPATYSTTSRSPMHTVPLLS